MCLFMKFKNWCYLQYNVKYTISSNIIIDAKFLPAVNISRAKAHHIIDITIIVIIYRYMYV